VSGSGDMDSFEAFQIQAEMELPGVMYDMSHLCPDLTSSISQTKVFHVLKDEQIHSLLLTDPDEVEINLHHGISLSHR
jgi:hypothetical protein